MSLAPALDLRPAANDVAAAHVPANVEAEQALLGALLYDNSAFERIGDYLKPPHFFEPVVFEGSWDSRDHAHTSGVKLECAA